MMKFWILFVVAMAISAIGFKKFVWFISLGYGFSIAGIGMALFALFPGNLTPVVFTVCCIWLSSGRLSSDS